MSAVQRGGGTAAHLFFECEFAKAVWRTVGLTNKIEEARCTRGDAWLRKLITENELGVAELLIMLCDGIWLQRNQQTFNDKHLGAELTAGAVAACLTHFQDANLWPERISEALGEGTTLKPPDTGPRLFFDDGLTQNGAGLSIVAMNAKNVFLRAVAIRLDGITDPVFAEAAALKETIMLAKDMNMDDAIIVGDAMNVISMVRGDVEPPQSCREYILEIQEDLHAPGVKLPFWTRRDNNKIAHDIASYTKLCNSGRME